jgi:hypothetical protein
VAGFQPTGSPTSIDEVYFFRVADDRLARVSGLEDTWTPYQQLRGVAPDPREHGSVD